MGRILAIDYGQKRVGFAVTDELQICANALTTVHVSEVFPFLQNYLAKESVDVIVIGEPKKMDNTKSDSSRFIDPFVNRLKKELSNVRIERIDERFTSKMAFQTMLDSGLKKKDRQNKKLLDTISATIILQSYLQQIEIEKERTEKRAGI